MTLNQVVLRINNICLAHKQIRSFGRGKGLEEFLNDKTTKYAAVFLHDNGGNINISGNVSTVNFRLFFFDLVHVSDETKDNELDVQSDMLSIAQDVLAQISYPGFDDWVVSQSNNIQLLAEEISDMLAGCVVDISISVIYDRNVCRTPSSYEDYVTTLPDMKNLFDIEYVSTGMEGRTIHIPALSGKMVLLVIKENAPLHKVSNNPDSVEYLWDGTVITLGVDMSPNERFLILFRTI